MRPAYDIKGRISPACLLSRGERWARYAATPSLAMITVVAANPITSAMPTVDHNGKMMPISSHRPTLPACDLVLNH